MFRSIFVLLWCQNWYRQTWHFTHKCLCRDNSAESFNSADIVSWSISIHIDLWRVDPRSSDFILEVTLRENHTVSIYSMFNMNIGKCWIMYLDGLPDLCQTTVALFQRSNSSFFLQCLYCRLLVNTILTHAINSHPFFAVFKDKGMFTVPLHGWYPFSSLLKDISYETAKCIWKCTWSTCHLLLAMEKYANVKAMLKVH